MGRSRCWQKFVTGKTAHHVAMDKAAVACLKDCLGLEQDRPVVCT